MSDIIVAPIIIFMLVVAPIWLILHYRSKLQERQGLSAEEYQQLIELSETADKMADRIKTLEDLELYRLIDFCTLTGYESHDKIIFPFSSTRYAPFPPTNQL